MYTYAYFYVIKLRIKTNTFKMEKDASITVRVSEKTKKKLRKMAEENRREFSDFIRLLLTDIADEKIKITL